MVTRPTKGKGLESLALASQFGVTLTQVPRAVRFLKRGHGGAPRAVSVPAPVDFFGAHLTSGGRLLVFDCKESREKYRLDTSEDHLPSHQRAELHRHGSAGAVAGLLVEHVPGLALYWCPWPLLYPPRPSIPYAEMTALGSSQLVITAQRWAHVVVATDLAVEKSRGPKEANRS